MFLIQTLVRTAPVLVLAAALAACSTFKPASPEEASKARAAEYWKARIAQQYDKAYSFTTPGYRAVTTQQQFQSRFGGAVILEKAEPVSATCEAEKCVVQMRITAKPMLHMANVGSITTSVDETWLLEDRQWWLYRAP